MRCSRARAQVKPGDRLYWQRAQGKRRPVTFERWACVEQTSAFVFDGTQRREILTHRLFVVPRTKWPAWDLAVDSIRVADATELRSRLAARELLAQRVRVDEIISELRNLGSTRAVRRAREAVLAAARRLVTKQG